MLFMVEMTVKLPPGMPDEERTALVAEERERALEIQRAGKWPHLWRVAGRYANVSVFDVESPDELHDLVSSLPLFPYMEIRVTPLARHPSKLD